jgi:hypothetical protein
VRGTRLRIRTWVAFASGDASKLSTNLYSEVLTEPHLAQRGWSAINDYLYTINPEESVQDPLRNAESLGAEKLLTPLHNWLVFEQQIGWILGRASDAATFVITLGGEDERAFWEAFHRGLLEWLLKAAIRLPAALNPGFREGLEPVLRDVDVLLRTPASELPTAAVGSIAAAVVEWLDV